MAHTLLTDKEEYNKMANAVNPYGDGKASERIVDAISLPVRQKAAALPTYEKKMC